MKVRSKQLRKACIGVVLTFVFVNGWRTYNELVDMAHFLHGAHGKLLVEMQRKQVVVSSCRNAVLMYATMENDLNDRMIELHRLTKIHGPKAQIVESEGFEIIRVVRELDLLMENIRI